jgi:hypothetical protein
MSTIPSIAPVEDTTPPKTRSDERLYQVRRLASKVEKARAAHEAAVLTRDMSVIDAMNDGWTAAEIGEAVGMSAVAVRQLVYKRRTGRPNTRRRREIEEQRGEEG